MEFWGVEVKGGKPTQCSPGEGMYLHVSQAALGESKAKGGKGSERVILKVHIDGGDIVLGTLSEGRCDQMPLDLVFDRDFKISHSGSSSSIFLCGYRTEGPREYDSDDEDEEEEDEEDEDEAGAPIAVPIKANGAAAEMLSKVTDKAAAAVANAIAKGIEKKVVKKQVIQDDTSDEDDSDDEEDDSEDDGMGHPFVSDLASESDDEFDAGDDDSDEDMDDDEDDDDDDEDDSDESEEEEILIETLKAGKKRPATEPLKAAEKKSKTDAVPQQGSGLKGKKGEKQVTPSKDGPKTPTDKGVKAKAPKGTPTAPPTTPVSEKKIGQHKCTGCDRTFTTESAMSQHAAAKHKA